MECSIMGNEKGVATVQVVFEPEVFQRAVIEEYREVKGGAINRKRAAMLNLSALLESDKQALSIVKNAVGNLVSDNFDSIASRLNLQPVARPYLQPISGEFDEPLKVVLKVNVAPDLDDLVYEGLQVSVTEVTADKTEVEKLTTYARTFYGASDDAELLAHFPQFDSMESMRAAMDFSVNKHIALLNLDERRNAVANKLLEVNPVEVSESEIDAYVSGELQKMVDQVGAQEFSDSLKASGQTVESIKEVIKADVGHVPALNILLTSIASALAPDVTDADRIDEIMAQRKNGIYSGQLAPAEDTLEEAKAEPGVLAALDRKVMRNKALQFVCDSAEYAVRMSVTLRERDSQFLSSFAWMSE